MTWIHMVGQQEYSSRWAGVTWGIILAVLVPIILVLICIGYRLVKKRREQEANDNMTLERHKPQLTSAVPINEDEDDDSLPYKKNLDAASDNENEQPNSNIEQQETEILDQPETNNLQHQQQQPALER